MHLIAWVNEIWYNDLVSKETIIKFFCGNWIMNDFDNSEDGEFNFQLIFLYIKFYVV